MAIMVELLNPSQWADASDGLQLYAALPEWLTAAIVPDRVIAALSRTAPDFAPGGLTIRACKIKHVGLDAALGAWAGEYNLTVAGPDSDPRSVLVHGVFCAPGAAEPAASVADAASRAFGTVGWHAYLPELRLNLRVLAPEPELPALPTLTDPEQARAVLEESIRAGAPAYHDIQIQACEPLMMRSRAGVRHVLRYRLSYAPALAATHSWPELVVAKTYDSDIGQNAYAAMRALWESPLGTSASVTIAEPLAYVPGPKILVQGPIQEEQTLEELVETAVRAGDQAALDELEAFLRKTAVGLAELHQSGVGYGRRFTWQDRLAQARGALDGLAVPLPALGEAAERMFAQLEAIAAAEPGDPIGPAHGAFRAAQVLIHQDQIGFIDFDGFCQAEPAMDLARFLATTKDVALDALFGKQKDADDPATVQRRQQALTQIEALCETFLQQYEQLAPISRRRVALWETLNIFTLVMSCWKKVKPARLKNTLLMLERQLSAGYAASPVASASAPSAIASGLRRLAVLPEWLLAPLQADRISEALRQSVPEFASGALELRGCKIKRMLLKDASGRWSGSYTVTIAEQGSKRPIALRGTFTPPDLRQPNAAVAPATALPFAANEWRMALPELGLELELEPPETELAAMPRLTDPAESRALLEQGIRADSPDYAGFRIAECRPEVLSYKPGSRCTLRYHLTYPPELADRGWPTNVIAKTYRKDSKGRNAYDGMLALWHTPLAAGDVVTLAEPLAYIPELKIMVQGPIASDQSLEDMLKSALDANSQPAMEELYGYMRKTAVALAAFHQSGVRHGVPVLLDARFAEIRDLIARLLIPAPELAGAVEPLLMRLEALAAAQPADAAVPTHGTFNPEQVLIDGEKIGLIDFDDFCMAEPALDVALFRAAIKDIGMNALDESMARNREIRLARLARLDIIAEIFLAEYEKHAPITRGRVALWEAWSYLRDSLHFWTKVKPAEPDNGLLMLESHLRDMGLYEPARASDAAKQPRKKAATPAFRYIALAYAVLASTWADELAEILGFLQAIV